MASSRLLGSALIIYELSRVAIIVVIVVILLVVFVGVPLPVSGSSMVPNFASGQIVLVERLSPTIKRGDVVEAKFPADSNHTKLIKRVLGLPGDTIYGLNGQIFLNGRALNESAYGPLTGTPPYQENGPLTLKTDEYFLVGDNRPGSSDSRLWGPVNRSDIQGRITFVVWPLMQAKYIDRPVLTTSALQ